MQPACGLLTMRVTFCATFALFPIIDSLPRVRCTWATALYPGGTAPYVCSQASRPDGPNSVTSHTGLTLTDASGGGAKTWNFLSGGLAWQNGLTSEFVQKASPSGTVYTDETYTWTQDPAGNPYIATKIAVTDPGGSNPLTAKTTQTLDQYGNATQAAIYPYNNTATPLKTYNSTYLNASTYTNGAAYVNAYILNRLLSTVLTVGGTQKTLVQNYYDGTTGGQAYTCLLY